MTSGKENQDGCRREGANPADCLSSMQNRFPCRFRPGAIRKPFGLLALACAMGAGAAPAPVGSIGFEPAEGFAIGQEVAARDDWSQSDKGAATITDEISDEGDQSLEVSKSTKDLKAVRKLAVPKDGILFVDFKIRPTADSEESPSYSIAINGAVLAFVKEGDTGTVVAVPSDQKPSIATNFSFAVDGESLATDWIRLTIREDAKAGTWDLFINGRLTLIDQPLVASVAPGAFQAYSSTQGRYFIDGVSISNANPLFPDADKDSLPDAEEIANGTNAYFNDRNSDLNLDGVSNIASFLAGRSSSETPSKSRKFIYIDNVNGNDAQTGEMSYSLQGQGPIKSVRRAASVSGEKRVIVLMPSNKPYVCPSYPKGAKIPEFSWVLLGNAAITGEEYEKN